MASLGTLRFLGATRNVTGSRFLIESAEGRVLVDCGLYQEREYAARNWEPFPVEPDSIDALLLTHAHLDHSGCIPRLVADGFDGPVYCTRATADLIAILLEDSARIQEEDAAFKKRRHGRECRQGPYPEVPLYTTADVSAALGLLAPVAYEEETIINSEMRVTFRDAGHILGSATLDIAIRTDPARITVVFSGDLGRVGGLLLHDPAGYRSADDIVTESTYGDRLHPQATDMASFIAVATNRAANAGGKVLIPSFAVEGAQDLLFLLRQLVMERRIPEIPFFVDSPMATDVTRVFERYPELLDPDVRALLSRGDSPFRFPGLTFVRSVEESKAINSMTGPAVIIAGAGMCSGGRIKHHLANNISDPNSVVLFVGYQAWGTLGRQIVDGMNPVRILGQMHDVRARIETVNGLSAHADQAGLLHWLDSPDVPPKRVFVVHGEDASAVSFAGLVHEKYDWDTIAPEYRDAFDLAR